MQVDLYYRFLTWKYSLYLLYINTILTRYFRLIFKDTFQKYLNMFEYINDLYII